MKKLTLDDVTWTLTAEPEDEPVRGNALDSGDHKLDRKVEDRILRQLKNGNEWAWCCVKVTGRWNGLEHREYLGCCSYASAEDFKKPDGYYQQMQAEILACLQADAETVAAAMSEEQSHDRD